MAKKKKDNLDIIAETIIKEGNPVTSENVNELLSGLKERIYQAMLEGEMNNHLGYSNNDKCDKETDNRRNGYSSKRKKVKTSSGDICIDMPRDRDGSFNPIIISKRQRIVNDDMNNVIITLYAKGNSQRDIVDIVKQVYNIDVSTAFINDVINEISKEVNKWKEKPLKQFYPFLFVDCLYVNIKKDLVSQKTPVYVIIGIDITGHKEVVGVWIGDSNGEGAYFWQGIFEELKERGVKDILFVSMDGLSGLNEAINSIYPLTKTQRCIVHLCRNLYKKCNRKEAKEVLKYFKKIYSAPNESTALAEFENFKEKFNNNAKIVKTVEDYMQYILPLFELPAEIRKIIYTTNAIESVNSALRKVTKGKGSFPSDEALMKVLFLRVKDLEKKWTNQYRGWNNILNQLIILFGERVTKYVEV